MSLWLPTVIGDGMVVQQDRPICVWGKSDNSKVSLSWNGQEYIVSTDSSHRWRAELETVPAGGPYELVIQSGTDKRTIREILCGEVWLASGQSNMAMIMKNIEDASTYLQKSDYPGIRLFKTVKASPDSPSEDVAGKGWKAADPAHVEEFSAVAYLFSKLLHERLQVPIGIMVSAVGATGVQSWISREKQESTPSLQELYKQSEQIEKDADRQPSLLFNGMVAGLAPYPIRGVLWYQGERNANLYPPHTYDQLLEALIEDWRQQFEQEELPFLFVQLPAYNAKADKDWARLRQEQDSVAGRVPGTGMAVTIDLGEANDIHPKQKYPVAERLFRIALDHVYGIEKFVGFPKCKRIREEDQRIIIEFDHVGSGLVGLGGGPVNEFEACGEDGIYYPVQALVTGKDRVEFPSVQPIQAVRYAWCNWMEPRLFNHEGLPAAPFHAKLKVDQANGIEGD